MQPSSRSVNESDLLQEETSYYQSEQLSSKNLTTNVIHFEINLDSIITPSCLHAIMDRIWQDNSGLLITALSQLFFAIMNASAQVINELGTPEMHTVQVRGCYLSSGVRCSRAITS